MILNVFMSYFRDDFVHTSVYDDKMLIYSIWLEEKRPKSPYLQV